MIHKNLAKLMVAYIEVCPQFPNQGLILYYNKVILLALYCVQELLKSSFQEFYLKIYEQLMVDLKHNYLSKLNI